MFQGEDAEDLEIGQREPGNVRSSWHLVAYVPTKQRRPYTGHVDAIAAALFAIRGTNVGDTASQTNHDIYLYWRRTRPVIVDRLPQVGEAVRVLEFTTDLYAK